ncbi:MAG: 4'-phosphopantetheinyl transferase superfamily protein [Bacteroidetes bacterium]|nr:4'-phosphopantetheinyl transferase superfamily protein [Bacteroidota bacterium]
MQKTAELLISNPSEEVYLATLNLVAFAEINSLSEKRVIEKQAALHAVRCFFKHADIEILYHSTGKPYLNNGWHLSISHSYDWIVLLFSNNKKEVGIDIEKISNRVQGIKDKFLSDAEILDLAQAPAEKYTTYWCAKETVYKAFGVEGLVFGDEILIENFVYQPQGGTIQVQIKRPNVEKKYTLAYSIFNEYIITYTL